MRKVSPQALKRAGLAGGVLLCAALLGWVGMWWYERSERLAQHYSYAPDFALSDITGRPVSLTESEGKVRVLNVWATWSPYSREELRVLAELAGAHAGVVFLALCRDTNTRDVPAYLAELGLVPDGPVRFVLDPEDDYFRLIDGFHMPETLVLGEHNEILYRVRGPFVREELDRALEHAARGEPYSGA